MIKDKENYIQMIVQAAQAKVDKTSEQKEAERIKRMCNIAQSPDYGIPPWMMDRQKPRTATEAEMRRQAERQRQMGTMMNPFTTVASDNTSTNNYKWVDLPPHPAAAYKESPQSFDDNAKNAFMESAKPYMKKFSSYCEELWDDMADWLNVDLAIA